MAARSAARSWRLGENVRSLELDVQFLPALPLRPIYFVAYPACPAPFVSLYFLVLTFAHPRGTSPSRCVTLLAVF